MLRNSQHFEELEQLLKRDEYEKAMATDLKSLKQYLDEHKKYNASLEKVQNLGIANKTKKLKRKSSIFMQTLSNKEIDNIKKST